MIFAALLALQVQQPATPAPFSTPPVSVSERATLDRELERAQSSAGAMGGMMGATVIDLTTGVEASTNGEVTFSMGAVQRLPVAVLAYRAVDAGTLALDQSVTVADQTHTIGDLISAMVLSDDKAAEDELLRLLHGPDAIDQALHALSFDEMFVEPDDGGYATPSVVARMLSELQSQTLLKPASSRALLALLGKVDGGGLRGGLPSQALLSHVTGSVQATGFSVTNDAGIAQIPNHTLLMVAMLRVPGGTGDQRDAVIAKVARAAVAGATVTPGQ